MPATPKPGSIVHVEVHSNEPARTKQFFSEVFGWKFEDVPEMDYTTFQAPSAPHGGLMKPMENSPPQVLNYILSANIEETSRRIETAGGAIVVPKTEIPKVSWFAIFREPGGTVQALYQNAAPPRPAPKPKPRKAPARKAPTSRGSRKRKR